MLAALVTPDALLDAALAIPRDGLPNILRRSTRIFAVTLVARRKIVSAPAERDAHPREPERIGAYFDAPVELRLPHAEHAG